MDDQIVDENQAFGRAVAARRAELGLSRKDVVARCGLSYPFLADIESGRKRPSAKALQALADALEVRPSELLERAEAIGGNRRGWFTGGGEALAAMREPLPRQDMRSLVREVVREELLAEDPGAPATRAADGADFAAMPVLAMRAGPAASGPPPDTASPSDPVHPLPEAIRAQLPKWLVNPAKSATDLALQALALERLHRLGPRASRVEIDTVINETLDHVIERARRRRR